MSTDLNPVHPDSQENQKLATFLALLAALVAAAAALGALFAPSGSTRAVAIGCGLLAVIALSLNIRFGRSKRYIAACTGVLVAITAASGGAALERSSQHDRTRAQSYPTLHISLSRHQIVPWCNTALNGTGRIPNTDTLLIFDREVSSDDQAASTSAYSLDGPAVPSGSNWSLTPMYVGPRRPVKDSYVEITGVLVTKSTAAFINDIRAAAWGTLTLPPAIVSTNAFVLRGGDLTQCA
jgi:hypothetical protein